jgi:hypothetical protein
MILLFFSFHLQKLHESLHVEGWINPFSSCMAFNKLAKIPTADHKISLKKNFKKY